jgi:hypothetical protein
MEMIGVNETPWTTLSQLPYGWAYTEGLQWSPVRRCSCLIDAKPRNNLKTVN